MHHPILIEIEKPILKNKERLQEFFVLHTMLHLLPDECLHALFEFGILNLLIEPLHAAYEVAFAGRKYRMQRVHEMRHERVAAKPVAVHGVFVAEGDAAHGDYVLLFAHGL